MTTIEHPLVMTPERSPADRARIKRNLQLVCAWCGPATLLAVAVGVVVLAGFVPGPSPAKSAARISSQYLHNLGGIRAGMCVFMAGIALLAPWGAVLAVQTHRANPGTPVLTATQIVLVAVTTMIGVLAPIAWGFAAFRAGSNSPELTRNLNDLGWIIFIFDWSPLAVWYASVGISIILDPSPTPVFPRWAAYLSFWTAGLSVPGGLAILFKTGPLAYNGLLALWIPLAVFGIWTATMTGLLIKAINREAREVAI